MVNNKTTVEKINGYFKDEYAVQNDFLCAEQLGPTNRERGFSGSKAPKNGGSIDCIQGTDRKTCVEKKYANNTEETRNMMQSSKRTT